MYTVDILNFHVRREPMYLAFARPTHDLIGHNNIYINTDSNDSISEYLISIAGVV